VGDSASCRDRDGREAEEIRIRSRRTLVLGAQRCSRDERRYRCHGRARYTPRFTQGSPQGYPEVARRPVMTICWRAGSAWATRSALAACARLRRTLRRDRRRRIRVKPFRSSDARGAPSSSPAPPRRSGADDCLVGEPTVSTRERRGRRPALRAEGALQKAEVLVVVDQGAQRAPAPRKAAARRGEAGARARGREWPRTDGLRPREEDDVGRTRDAGDPGETL
jgi:hypothetical protein